MLLGSIDSNVICILERWKSYRMLRYLHFSVQSLTHNHTRTMLHGRHNNLLAPALSMT